MQSHSSHFLMQMTVLSLSVLKSQKKNPYSSIPKLLEMSYFLIIA